jgi:hypothetical protein
MTALLTDHLKQQTRSVKCIMPESIVVTDNHDILKQQLQSKQTLKNWRHVNRHIRGHCPCLFLITSARMQELGVYRYSKQLQLHPIQQNGWIQIFFARWCKQPVPEIYSKQVHIQCPICQYSCVFKQTFVFFMHHKHRAIFSLGILRSYSCTKTTQSTFNPRSTSGSNDVNVFLIHNNACEIHWYQKYQLYEFHVN